VIPVGALALAEDGNLYSCTEEGTIADIGSVTLPFACNATGPIACAADSLNQIYRAIPGWDTINNVADGVPGRNAETRAEFEARRAASVAQNSVGSLPAIQGAVLSVANVLDVYVTENVLGTTRPRRYRPLSSRRSPAPTAALARASARRFMRPAT
jgi:hypothetical protein